MAQVIQINKFGSLHLNITHQQWDDFSVEKNQNIQLELADKILKVPFVEAFGNVPIKNPLILRDDYGRMEVALNMGDFAKEYNVKMGDSCAIIK